MTHREEQIDIDQLVDAANACWEDDSLRTPTNKSWGFYAYGDAPGGIGGGVGMFCWFDGRAPMLKFIADVLPFSPPGPSTSDPLEVASRVRQTLDQVKAGELTLVTARTRLNKVLRSYSQIEWIGTFKDLKDGASPYARRLIQEFRRQYGLPVSTRPIHITPSQMADFRLFLSEYGC